MVQEGKGILGIDTSRLQLGVPKGEGIGHHFKVDWGRTVVAVTLALGHLIAFFIGSKRLMIIADCTLTSKGRFLA